MIPFNPCGLICDWGRHRYVTKCRFFRDDARVDEITWYPAAPGAKCIPFPTVFYQGIWDRDPDEIEEYVEGVGEVWDEERKTDHMVAPPGSGTGHYCGTPEMFLEGASFDPAFHVAVRADGLPVCCPGGIGGLFWGGRGVVPPPARGGVKWRGHGEEGWDVTYFAFGTGGVSSLMFAFLDPNEIWTTFLGPLTLYSPIQTGTPGLWRLVNDGSFPPYPSGTWETTGWTGWGTGSFALISGGPLPTTYTVERGDGL